MTAQQAAKIDELRQSLSGSAPTAAGHLKLGTALLKAGAGKEAERELRAAIELDPKCAGAWVNLGGILLARWDYAASVAANRRALAAQPDFALAHYNEAIGHLYLGEPEAAVDCLKRVVELEPRNGAAYYYLGVALLSAGQNVESRLCVAYAAELGYEVDPLARKAYERAAAGGPEAGDEDDEPSSQSSRTPSTSKEKDDGNAEGR